MFSYFMPDIKLCDLGSVRWERDFNYDVITTLQYRAPDVIMGHKIGYPCDVWSIGCTLYELFIGEVLFDASTVQELLRMIHFMIENFTGDEVEMINRKLSEDGEIVDVLNEQELGPIKGKTLLYESKKMRSYTNNQNRVKLLWKLINRMIDRNPVSRVKLKNLNEEEEN